jgi:hypothetical protein
MRKALLLNLLLLIASAFCLPGRANADPIVPIVSISLPSSVTVTAGSTFKVDVNISGVANLFAFQLDLGFSPTLVQAIDVTEGAFLPSGGLTYFVPGSIGSGSFSSSGDALFGPSGASGSGTLLQFDFKAIAAGTSPLTLSNILLLDTNFNLLNKTAVDGSVTITPAISTPESSVIVFLAAAAMFLLLSRRAWRIS